MGLTPMKQPDHRLDFAPDLLRLQGQLPSPLPRALMYVLLALFGLIIAGAFWGRLDIVASAQGRIVPQSFLKIVQSAEQGIVREILVKDGDAVAQGQTLVRMDARISTADRNIVQSELRMRDLQLRRIDAELLGQSLARLPEDDAEQLAQVEAQLRARLRAHRDAVDAERALLVRAEQDLKVALEIEGKLRKTVPIYREQAEGWETLAREGFAGKLLALDRQRVYLENAQDLRTQAHSIEGLRAGVMQSSTRLEQISSNHRRLLHEERNEAQAQRHRLRQEFDKLAHRAELLELRAPQDGVVKDLATHTPGTVVAPGTILLSLVPQNEPLLAEVWINNADAGFVRPKHKTRLKVAAYPFQKHGMLDGLVQHISADAQEPSNESRAVRPFQEAAYRALIALDSNYLRSQGGKLQVVPGMLVTAEIHLGTRSVIEYLLSPVQKITQEAGRER